MEVIKPAKKTKSGGLKDLAVHRGHEMYFYADQLRPRGHNPRMWELERNRNRVIEFARIARQRGILVPIQVSYEGKQILVEQGETRWLCVKLLEGEDVRGVLSGVTDPDTLALLGCVPKNTIEIPATRAAKGDNLDRLLETILTNNGGQLNDLERARVIKEAVESNKTQGWIAEYLGGKEGGWTQTRVSHLYQLNLAPVDIRDLIAREVIATSTWVNAKRDHKDDAEAMILAAVEHSKKLAGAKAEKFQQEAREAQAEVDLLIREGDDGMIVPEPSKKPITKVEHAQRRVSSAMQKAEAAKAVAEKGPAKVTSREIDQAAVRRNPQAKANTPLSRLAQNAFIDAVKFEAQYCKDEATRARMNSVLAHHGFPALEPRVDNDGNDLPLASEMVDQAAAA